MAASVVLNAAALYVGRGWWVHFVGVGAIILWLGVPALAIAAILYGVSRRYPGARRAARRVEVPRIEANERQRVSHTSAARSA